MDLSTLNQITNNFTHELAESENGEKTSLAFIKNTIPSFSLVKEGETFQVLVIGGTNFRSALVKKNNNQIEILSISAEVLPIMATKQIFIDFIESKLTPDIRVVAINFANAIQPIFEKGRLDGTLLFASKEHAYEGLYNEKICQTLEDYFLKRDRKIIFSITNDTICLLLSGLTQHNEINLGAGIVGTGINFALFLDKTTLINTEAGSFDKFPQTKSGQQIDRMSLKPNEHIFEKEIAGGYLYQHFNILIKEKHIQTPLLDSTEALSELAVSKKDFPERNLARELLIRSAQFASCVIAGIANFKKQDMTFVMQGSLFWKGYQYRKTVLQTVKDLTHYKVTFVDIENSDILGAAKLVA